MTRRQANNQSSVAERFAALNRVGTALMSELDESRLLYLIAETACNLTEATFAAFTLRPVDEIGQPLVPAEGNLFQLAAVVGVSKAEEDLFRHMPLGGEGLLAPIFRDGIPVLIPDALNYIHKKASRKKSTQKKDAVFTFSHGAAPSAELHSIGLPRGHPIVRSFLGVPVLDRAKQIRGGLLLGHTEPGRFTHDNEALLVGLAAQAAVALENARLYRTAQMRAQELTAIFESIADGVTLVDQQGNILRENSTARNLREQLILYPTGQQAIEALLHKPALRALAGELAQGIEVKIEHAHKEIRQYTVNASPLRAAKTPSGSLAYNVSSNPAFTESSTQATMSRAVIVWHDVTEARRLQTERRIHAETETRRALLQLILDELPSSVYLVHGHDARLVIANRAATTVWGAYWPVGLPMADFLAQNNIRVFGTDGLELAPEQRATARVLHNCETIHHHQEVIRHPDGTTLPVLVNAVALDTHEIHLFPHDLPADFAASSEPAAIVVHQDVTALKDAERLKDEFIGIAAHELRNPLAVLKGFAQTLIIQTARGKGPELVDWQMEALQGIDQATLRMVELIDDLLDVTRLQAGRLELQLEPTDIIALTRRVITRLQITTEQHTLLVNTPREYIVTLIDPRRVEQILNNLVNNAIKYSPQGGTIDILLDEDTVSQMAVIRIQDHGIGITAYQQARIFGRFVRADNARKHGIGGTGLGLYLCRELVERHGGQIWFESTEGQGSLFSMTLPIATAALNEARTLEETDSTLA